MTRRNLYWIAAVVLVSLVCSQWAISAREEDNYGFFRVFVDTVDRVERHYVREVEQDELFEGGLVGLVESLDPDSSYLPPGVLQRAQRSHGPLGDIGVYLAMDTTHQWIFVLGVIPGTPAEQAGVMPGDLLLEIDDHSTRRFTLEEAAQRLQGKPGTSVTLKLSRRHGPPMPELDDEIGAPVLELEPDAPEPMPEGTPPEPILEPPSTPERLPRDGSVTLTLSRVPLEPPGLLGSDYSSQGGWEYILEGTPGVGYVRLPAFVSGVAEQLDEVVTKLQEQGVKGLILDLRFNPGGQIEEAVAAADRFLSEGQIVTVKGPNRPAQDWQAQPDEGDSDIPLVVLVNRYTVGPAEVLAAALQDHGRAKVVGERTRGRAGVSELIMLRDGQSALKLTTATCWRPAGQSIHRFRDAEPEDGWGVRPDEGLEVKQDIGPLVQYLRSLNRSQAEGPSNGYVDQTRQRAVELLTAPPVSEEAAPERN